MNTDLKKRLLSMSSVCTLVAVVRGVKSDKLVYIAIVGCDRFKFFSLVRLIVLIKNRDELY